MVGVFSAARRCSISSMAVSSPERASDSSRSKTVRAKFRALVPDGCRIILCSLPFCADLRCNNGRSTAVIPRGFDCRSARGPRVSHNFFERRSSFLRCARRTRPSDRHLRRRNSETSAWDQTSSIVGRADGPQRPVMRTSPTGATYRRPLRRAATSDSSKAFDDDDCGEPSNRTRQKRFTGPAKIV